MKLFQFAILLHPSEEEAKAGKPTRLIGDIRTVLAKDMAQATLIAGRSINEDQMSFLDRIEVAVRPF